MEIGSEINDITLSKLRSKEDIETEVLLVYHFWERNLFVDSDGEEIVNIMDHLHPHDVKRFRTDPGDCHFPHRFHKNVFVEVMSEDDNPVYQEWRKEIEDAKNRWDIHRNVCSGGRCWLSSDSGLSREEFEREICGACGAREACS